MELNKAKEILSALFNFLPCHKFAFIGPAEPASLDSFLETAMYLHNGPRPLKVLLTDSERMDKILKDDFPAADLDIFVASKYFDGRTGAQAFRDYIQEEDIAFDVSKYL